MPTIRDRVVDTVGKWCSQSGFDTDTSLKTLWLNGPNGASVPFAPNAVGKLIADLTSEFSKPEKRDLSSWSPTAFAPGDPIDTVEDLVLAVRFALPPVAALVHGFGDGSTSQKFISAITKASKSKMGKAAKVKNAKTKKVKKPSGGKK